MADRPIESLTLREKFTDAERLTRDLIEHLDQGFNPRAHALVQLVRPTSSGAPASNVKDVTVRNYAQRVLESEAFTKRMWETSEKYFMAIDKVVSRIVSGE